jgi:hypothetical protein
MKKKNSAVNEINCLEAVSRFNDFMDNYLNAKARHELMKHIAECRQCLERLEFEQLLKSRVHLLSKLQQNDHIIRKIERLIATI